MKYTNQRFYRTYVPVTEPVPELDGVHVDVVFARIIDQIIWIAGSYWWNGASFLLFYWFGTPDRWMLPSLVHDVLYELMRIERLDYHVHRKIADQIFYRLLMERQPGRGRWWGWLVYPFWWLQCQWAYWGVRIFGRRALAHTAGVKEVV